MNEDQWSASLKLFHYYSIINIHCTILNMCWLLKIINIMCHLDLLSVMQEKTLPTAVLWRNKGIMQIILFFCLILFFKLIFKKHTIFYKFIGCIQQFTIDWRNFKCNSILKVDVFLQTTLHRNNGVLCHINLLVTKQQAYGPKVYNSEVYRQKKAKHNVQQHHWWWGGSVCATWQSICTICRCQNWSCRNVEEKRPPQN